MYAYRCLCKSLNGVSLLVKCCVTALLYENLYSFQKAAGCLAWKGLVLCGGQQNHQIQKDSIFFPSEQQFTSNSANNTFLIKYLINAFYIPPLPSTGWWRGYAPWLVGVRLVQDLELEALQGRWQWLLTSECSLLPQRLDFLGWKPEWTVAYCSEGDSWWGHVNEVLSETSQCLLWRFTFVHHNAFFCVYFYFSFYFVG